MRVRTPPEAQEEKTPRVSTPRLFFTAPESRGHSRCSPVVRSAHSIIPSLLIIEDGWRQLTIGGDLEPEFPSQRGASRASPAHPGASGFRAAHL